MINKIILFHKINKSNLIDKLVLYFHNLHNRLKEYFLFHQKYKLVETFSNYLKKNLENFNWIIYASKGASKNKDDQAIFSKEGPNLISPELTNNLKLSQRYINLKIKLAMENLSLKLKLQTKERLK